MRKNQFKITEIINKNKTPKNKIIRKKKENK